MATTQFKPAGNARGAAQGRHTAPVRMLHSARKSGDRIRISGYEGRPKSVLGRVGQVGLDRRLPHLLHRRQQHRDQDGQDKDDDQQLGQREGTAERRAHDGLFSKKWQ